MFRTPFTDVPRPVTVGLVAIALAIIGFFFSAIMPSLVYAFPALRPSNPLAKRTKKRRQIMVPTGSKVSIMQINAQIAMSALIRPRQLIANRCRSIPANWDLSRVTCVQMTRKSSKSSSPEQARFTSVKRKLKSIKEETSGAVLKTAKDTIRRVPNARRLTLGNFMSSRKVVREDTVVEEVEEQVEAQATVRPTAPHPADPSKVSPKQSKEPLTKEQDACLSRSHVRVEKQVTIFKSISAVNISGATNKLIKNCKLDAPARAINRESRKLVSSVAEIFPPPRGTVHREQRGTNNSPTDRTETKRRPSFLRAMTDREIGRIFKK